MNNVMTDFISRQKDTINQEKLETRMEKILTEGFFERYDCLFLTEIYPTNYHRIPFTKEGIIKSYHDLSGFEVSTNKLYVDDYTEKDIYLQSFAFLREFKKIWRDTFFNRPCVVCIGFQDDEVGKFATFTFHKKRKNEEVFDIENIEGYTNPIYVEIF